MKNLNIENISVPPSSQGVSLKKKLQGQKSRKSIEIPKRLKSSAQIKSFKNLTQSIEEIPVYESMSLPMSSDKTLFLVEEKEKEKEKENNCLLERFIAMAVQLKTCKKPVFLGNFHWILYKQWRFTLKRGINRIELKWKKKREAQFLLRSWIQSSVLVKAYKARVLSARVIQKYWTQVYKIRKYFLSAKTIATVLAPYAK